MKKAPKIIVIALLALFFGFIAYKVIDGVFINPEAPQPMYSKSIEKSSYWKVDVKWAKITCKEIAFGNFEPVELCDTSIVSTDAVSFRSPVIVKIKNIDEVLPEGVHPGEGYEPVSIRYIIRPK